MIGIVDYGMGNLRSVQKALERVGAEAEVVADASEVAAADRLILPGVGAFADAMTHLRERGLDAPVTAFARSGKPFLGICLGLQLLFESSEEDGAHEGLGLLPGRVIRFEPTDPTLKVPQMGWNELDWGDPAPPLMIGLEPGAHVYFVHSYYATPTDPADVAATTNYGGPFCSAVHRDNLHATQFHPEKSQNVGLRILENFSRL